jgi:K+-sensing histidine kinase KdpD
LNDGQKIFSLGELVDICEPKPTTTNEEVFLLDETDFIESTDGLFVEKVLRRGLPLENMNVYSGKCIVLNKRLNGIAVCPIEGTFGTNKNCLVLRLKEDKRFSLNYLAHSIITNEQIKATSFYGTQLDNNIAQIMLDIKLPVYATRNMQEALMVRLKDEYIQMKEREFKKEMERYGIRAASSDLNHLLGPTYSRIHSLLNQLRKDCEEQNKVDSIRDNIEYMDRMIKHAGLDFKNYDSTLEETGINQFFQEYIEACRNISTTSFELKYETDIDEDTTFCVDKDMFRYLLDTIMDNVYRHGFDKRVVEGAVVQVTTTPTLIDDKPYLVLSIANNGKPLAEDFSIEKFIGRGEKCGSSAHSGLGGYHIYHIIKNHKGYLNMTSSSKWSVIYEILIPIEDLFDDKTKLLNYENRTSAI